MKLEVGMYVRSKRGQLGKIISIGKYNFAVDFNGMSQDCIFIENIAKKLSFNIIDLIENGDYVNGLRVVDIIPNNRKLEPSTMIYCEYGNGLKGFYDEDIKTIVTYEQMKQIEYKVVD